LFISIEYMTANIDKISEKQVTGKADTLKGSAPDEATVRFRTLSVRKRTVAS